MLQRKQSLFLLLAALCGGLTFLFPVDTFTRGLEKQSYVFRTYGVFTADGAAMTDATLKVPFAVLIGVLSALVVALIFLYRNRPRQLRMTRMAALLLIAVQAFLFITDNSIHAYLKQGGPVERSYGPAFFLPLLMIVLVLMAANGIKKDEELIKSMDRLR
ncbi:MAG TPA: DUF4293 domain-containing protein [Flavobacteriales bacterium]|nr:DUF4293 domain-containing protein [Flavobacteriales bacterium]